MQPGHTSRTCTYFLSAAREPHITPALCRSSLAPLTPLKLHAAQALSGSGALSRQQNAMSMKLQCCDCVRISLLSWSPFHLFWASLVAGFSCSPVSVPSGVPAGGYGRAGNGA
eukprot:scaffold230942_cov19-Tisochrysis_lutea.AAC.2